MLSFSLPLGCMCMHVSCMMRGHWKQAEAVFTLDKLLFLPSPICSQRQRSTHSLLPSYFLTSYLPNVSPFHLFLHFRTTLRLSNSRHIFRARFVCFFSVLPKFQLNISDLSCPDQFSFLFVTLFFCLWPVFRVSQAQPYWICPCAGGWRFSNCWLFCHYYGEWRSEWFLSSFHDLIFLFSSHAVLGR